MDTYVVCVRAWGRSAPLNPVMGIKMGSYYSYAILGDTGARFFRLSYRLFLDPQLGRGECLPSARCDGRRFLTYLHTAWLLPHRL